MNPIKTKICGITRIEDAIASVEAGADAIGLNFYHKSKRFVEAKAAKSIANSVREQLAIVGVFVNSSAEEVSEVAEQVGLDFVQLHGDESPELAVRLRELLNPSTRMIRAIRVPADDLQFAQQEVDSWEAFGIDMLLFDPASADAFGGTGKRLDWSTLSKLTIQRPWLLAGGLTPENAAQAISASGPNGADVASGVEVRPGVKDHEAIVSFVKNVLDAIKASR